MIVYYSVKWGTYKASPVGLIYERGCLHIVDAQLIMLRFSSWVSVSVMSQLDFQLHSICVILTQFCHHVCSISATSLPEMEYPGLREQSGILDGRHIAGAHRGWQTLRRWGIRIQDSGTKEGPSPPLSFHLFPTSNELNSPKGRSITREWRGVQCPPFSTSGENGAVQLKISHFEFLPESLSPRVRESKTPRCFQGPGRQNTPRQEEKADQLLIAIKLYIHIRVLSQICMANVIF